MPKVAQLALTSLRSDGCPKPRIILFFAIAAGLGQIVRISNILEIVDWGRPGPRHDESHGLIDAMLSRLSFMKPVLGLAFHGCASNRSIVHAQMRRGHYSRMVLPRCLFQFLCHRINRDDISLVLASIWKAAVFLLRLPCALITDQFNRIFSTRRLGFVPSAVKQLRLGGCDDLLGS